jgi:hypothetical protein
LKQCFDHVIQNLLLERNSCGLLRIRASPWLAEARWPAPSQASQGVDPISYIVKLLEY